MSRIAVYSRKSKFTGKGESIENQIELCKEYIRSHYKSDSEIVIYEDEGFSGGNIDRPQFKKLMRDAKEKKFNVLVCYRLDRVSRNIADFASLIGQLNELNVAFVSIKELFDTGTPMGRAMMFIASVFSQLERETIAERIRDNMMELAKTGRWLGGNAPTGYKSEGYTKVSVDGKIKKAFKLVPIDSEQELIKIMFGKYIELKSQTALETYLIQNNLKSKNGKYFTRFTIRCILENPVYAIADKYIYNYLERQGVDIFADERDFNGNFGIMAYNKTIQVKNKTNKHRDIGEWVISIGLHQGIIAGSDWVKVQEILEENIDKRYRRPRTNNSLLTGLIRCGDCSSLMRPKMHRTENTDGEVKFSYLCEMKDKSKGMNCTARNLNGIELDKQIVEVIKIMLAPKKPINAELIKFVAIFEEDEDKTKIQQTSLRNTYNKNKLEIDSLINKLKYIDNDLIKDITDEIRKLKNANKNLEIQINELSNDSQNTISDKETAKFVLDIINNYFSIFNTLDLMQKRNMLKLIIKDIIVKGDDIIINFLGTGDVNQFPLGEYSK